MTLLEIKKLAERYNELGWVAFVYPRKKTVSLNGMRAISFEAAADRMKEAINSADAKAFHQHWRHIFGD